MKKILFVMFSLNSGGAERALINLLSIIDKDRYEIDLLLFSKEGAFLKLVPEYVNIIETPTVLQYFYESHHCFSANRILAYGYKCMATLLSYARDRRLFTIVLFQNSNLNMMWLFLSYHLKLCSIFKIRLRPKRK